MNEIIFILYVKDQARSRDFYSKILDINPSLDVPGMTEFALMDNVKLGLMPETGIKKILSDKTPDPANGNGIPRCELYLYVDNPEFYYLRALEHGAVSISNCDNRDWGDYAGYCADTDGNVIAFACRGDS